MQDILFDAGVSPKNKVLALGSEEHKKLLQSAVNILGEMAAKGGRDTEKDIYGIPGGYVTKMSKNSLEGGCTLCGGEIKKEAYLGGSVYYCPNCQPIKK